MKKSILLIIFLPGLLNICSAQAITTFDSGLEGWFGGSGVDVTHVSTGGNPGGYLLADDIQGGTAIAYNNTSFLGDFSATYGQTLSFDAANFEGAFVNDNNLGRVTIFGGGTSVAEDLIPQSLPIPDNNWYNFSAVLDETVWGSRLNQVLSNVTGISLVVESRVGRLTDLIGIDNFSFGTVAPIPEPSSSLLLGIGVLGLLARRKR